MTGAYRDKSDVGVGWKRLCGCTQPGRRDGSHENRRGNSTQPMGAASDQTGPAPVSPVFKTVVVVEVNRVWDTLARVGIIR